MKSRRPRKSLHGVQGVLRRKPHSIQTEESHLPWIRNPLEARYLERLNRFACMVELDGRPAKVHLPNSGRLEELLLPGARVIVERRRDAGKTLYDMLLVQSQRYPDSEPLWVGLDSRRPQALLEWLVTQGLLDVFGTLPFEVKREPRVGRGRLDLSFKGETGVHLVETKSVNLLDCEGIARFPDAPTSRGARHLESLVEMQAEGFRPWVVFVIQREDARGFSPFAERDPAFTEALLRAQEAGVGVLALRFAAGNEMVYQGPTEVFLPATPFPGFWPHNPSAR